METNKKIPDCPVEMTLQLIGDKWKVLIIRDLMSGTKRFNELMRSVSGITQKVLTSHLRAMERDGLVNRKVYPEVPPKVEYSLTDTGRSRFWIPCVPGELIIRIRWNKIVSNQVASTKKPPSPEYQNAPKTAIFKCAIRGSNPGHPD